MCDSLLKQTDRGPLYTTSHAALRQGPRGHSVKYFLTKDQSHKEIIFFIADRHKNMLQSVDPVKGMSGSRGGGREKTAWNIFND